MFATLVHRAERLVFRYAGAIERVAKALITYRRLTGEDIETLCPDIIRGDDPTGGAERYAD